tara:strand:- start:82747 stop:82947 length:201 start_codon:yes stop_codon:yes gene_type:complete
MKKLERMTAAAVILQHTATRLEDGTGPSIMECIGEVLLKANVPECDVNVAIVRAEAMYKITILGAG